MNNVNKTLYIPLYGKAFVSKKGLFLEDKKAEKIWDTEGFALKGKSKSKWLAYYMGVRAAVFDNWVKEKLQEMPSAAVVHIGCGLDSRAERVGAGEVKWFDIDFPEVIEERRLYYAESDSYKMLEGDATDCKWIEAIDSESLIVIMEGVSMYIPEEALRGMLLKIGERFDTVALLMDCYSTFAAKMSKYKNPINDVGVTEVYGIDDATRLSAGKITFVKEHEMTPSKYIDELSGMEKAIFKRLYAGKFASKLYRLYEYRK